MTRIASPGRALGALFVGIGLLVATPTAQAGTVSVRTYSSGAATLEYRDPGAESNVLSVAFQSSSNAYVVREEAATLVAGDACVLSEDSREATCTMPPGTPVADVDTGRGADDVTVSGGARYQLTGGEGDDVLTGGDATPVRFFPGAGTDSVRGGAATTDMVDYSGTVYGVVVALNTTENGRPGESDDIFGVENVRGTSYADELTGDGEANLLEGGGHSDTLRGAGGTDVLRGDDEPGWHPRQGRDVLDGGEGADVLDGGGGTNDTITYQSRGADAGVAILLDGLTNDGADPDGSGRSARAEEGDRDIGVEMAVGGGGPDRIVLSDTPHQQVYDTRVVRGLGGNDQIDGRGVAERIEGGSGDDLLRAAGADDTLVGGPGSDTLDGGEGRDEILYSATGPLAIKLDGVRNDGADPNQSGASAPGEEADRDISIEKAVGGPFADRLSATGTADVKLDGGDGNDVVSGAGGADILEGGVGPASGDDSIFAGPGNDLITDGGGANRLRGEEGDDTLRAGRGRDVLDGGTGIDLIDYFEPPWGYRGRVAIRLDGVADDGHDPNGSRWSTADEEGDRDISIEGAQGTASDDYLVGNTRANRLLGADGDDRIDARDGTAVADTVDCGRGYDQHAGDAVDQFSGCETGLP